VRHVLARSLGILIGGSLTLWLLAAAAADWLGEDKAFVHSGAAFLLCLVPTSLTLVWSRTALASSPEQQLLAVVGGTGIRMIFVIGAAAVLFQTTVLFHDRAFWLWVIGAYLVTLGLEVLLVVRQQVQVEHSQRS
jgi:hypothetical protein